MVLFAFKLNPGEYFSGKGLIFVIGLGIMAVLANIFLRDPTYKKRSQTLYKRARKMLVELSDEIAQLFEMRQQVEAALQDLFMGLYRAAERRRLADIVRDAVSLKEMDREIVAFLHGTDNAALHRRLNDAIERARFTFGPAKAACEAILRQDELGDLRVRVSEAVAATGALVAELVGGHRGLVKILDIGEDVTTAIKCCEEGRLGAAQVELNLVINRFDRAAAEVAKGSRQAYVLFSVLKTAERALASFLMYKSERDLNLEITRREVDLADEQFGFLLAEQEKANSKKAA